MSKCGLFGVLFKKISGATAPDPNPVSRTPFQTPWRTRLVTRAAQMPVQPAIPSPLVLGNCALC